MRERFSPVSSIAFLVILYYLVSTFASGAWELICIRVTMTASCSKRFGTPCWPVSSYIWCNILLSSPLRVPQGENALIWGCISRLVLALSDFHFSLITQLVSGAEQSARAHLQVQQDLHVGWHHHHRRGAGRGGKKSKFFQFRTDSLLYVLSPISTYAWTPEFPCLTDTY